MCRAIFPLYRLVQPSNGGLRCCYYCQHSGHCIGIGAVAYRLHWRELRLTRILLAVHLPSSFAFRRRLHRFRIFASDLTGPSRLFFCRQRSFLSHRHWPGWDTAHSLTHTHAYGALSNHLLVVVNPPFLSIGYLVSVHLRLFDSNHFPRPPTIFFFFLAPAPHCSFPFGYNIYRLSASCWSGNSHTNGSVGILELARGGDANVELSGIFFAANVQLRHISCWFFTSGVEPKNQI